MPFKNLEKRKLNQQKYRESHKEQIKEYRKQYRKTHREQHNAESKKYNQLHKEEIKLRRVDYELKRREIRKEYQSEYRKTHKEVVKELNKKYYNNRRKNDLNFKILGNLRARINHALKGNTKSERTINLLGCSVEFFKKYYETKFTAGMTWEKVMNGEIHCDHIRPCSSFDLSKPEEQKVCFNYTNLQPLWSFDNILKSDKF